MKGTGSVPPGEKPPSTLQFGVFTLDLQRRGLYRGSERVHLTSKPLETLIALVERRGHTVGKQQLLDLVWGATAVTEGTLVQAIREIRRVLDDDKGDPAFVQTVPREGYRFVGCVIEATPTVLEGALADVAAPIDDAAPPDLDVSAFDAGADVRGRGLGRPALLFAGLTIALLAGVWLGGYRRVAPAEPFRLPPPSRPPLQLTHGMVSAVKPAFSPDGKVMLYVSSEADAPGVLDLHVMPSSGGQAWRITDNANASGDLPVFWPDGTSVVFSRYRGGEDGSRLPDLWRVPAFGGPIALLLTEASGAGFSPRGDQVAYTKHLGSRRPLWLSQVTRLGDHREIAEPGYTPRWSPDGRWLAYTSSNPEGGLGHLFVSPAAGGPARSLSDAATQFYGFAWTADSRSIIASARRTGTSLLWRYALDGAAPEIVLTGVGVYTAPSTSPDGRTLAFCYTRPARDIMVADDVDAAAKALTVDEYHRWPRLSPSGGRIAGVLDMPGSGEYLYVIDAASGERHQAGTDEARHPAWIDDDEIAYVAVHAERGRSAVKAFRLSTNGVRTVASFEGEISWPAVRHGGRELAVARRLPSGETQLLVRNAETGSTLVLASGGTYEHLRWVPGRDAISWSGPEVGGDPAENGVWVVDVNSARPRRLLPDGYNPAWSGDGSALFYSRPREIGDGLWRLDLASGRTARIRSWQRVPVFDIVGTRLVYGQDSGRSQIHAVDLR